MNQRDRRPCDECDSRHKCPERQPTGQSRQKKTINAETERHKTSTYDQNQDGSRSHCLAGHLLIPGIG